MKNKLLTLFIFFFIFQPHIFPQKTEFNLKKLDDIGVSINDSHGYLSTKVSQKLLTEVKLKLMSSGLKVVPVEDAKAKLIININAIESNFGEHRILVQLNLYEDCITLRKGSPKTLAITYSDYSFFKDRVIEQSVYDQVMDIMLINFIESYLSQKMS